MPKTLIPTARRVIEFAPLKFLKALVWLMGACLIALTWAYRTELIKASVNEMEIKMLREKLEEKNRTIEETKDALRDAVNRERYGQIAHN